MDPLELKNKFYAPTLHDLSLRWSSADGILLSGYGGLPIGAGLGIGTIHPNDNLLNTVTTSPGGKPSMDGQVWGAPKPSMITGPTTGNYNQYGKPTMDGLTWDASRQNVNNSYAQQPAGTASTPGGTTGDGTVYYSDTGKPSMTGKPWANGKAATDAAATAKTAMTDVANTISGVPVGVKIAAIAIPVVILVIIGIARAKK